MACAASFVSIGMIGACSGESPEPPAPELTAVDRKAIVGGTKTSNYPSAALLAMHATAGGSYVCTAAVIAPHVVLTAGHCVDGMDSFQIVTAGSLRAATDAETYDWQETNATTVNPLHHDIGLVYVNEPFDLPSYPSLAADRMPDGTRAIDVGRIHEGTVTNDFWAAPIELRNGLYIGYPYAYSAKGIIEHGDSGGPVFLSGTQTIVAVNSGIGSTTQVVARVDLLRTWILTRIAQHGGLPDNSGPPSPAGGIVPGLPIEAQCAADEAEPNGAANEASTLTTMSCGMLWSSDVDWFQYDAPQGKTTLTLDPLGDAVATFGFLNGKRCIPSVVGVRAATVNVTSGKAIVCVGITSPNGEPQSYRLGVRH